MPKVGYVAIIGRPNVGKSTLLNALVGEKLAGISPKPQTTRGPIRGILTEKPGQIIFVDTAGLHEPRDLLGKWMVGEAEKVLSDVDLIVWMVLPKKPAQQDQKILELIQSLKKTTILIINQIDYYPKPEVLPVIEHYRNRYAFKEIIPISAKQNIQLDTLLKTIYESLPEGQLLFPKDQISDQQERSLVEEILREKVFHQLGEELPYSTAIQIERFHEREDGLSEIHASVIVEKDSQKAIVIGKRGSKLKEIGQKAREDIEKLLRRKVFLKLWVKTLKNWKRDENQIRKLGYDLK